MSNVRVTYSGLISFVITISTLVTGTIFTLIVTRRLSPEDLGSWSLIGGIITYVLIIEPIISTWSVREIARGIKSGKTAVASSGVFSIVGIFVYLIIAFFVGQNTEANTDALFFAIMLIPMMFLNRTLTTINLGSKPQAASYGLITFEIAKIPMGMSFVYYLDLGIKGAILASTIAYLCSIIILLYNAKDQIVSKIQKQFLSKWLKLSWLALYSGKLHSTVQYFDVAIFSLITGSVTGLSYWTVAVAIAAIVGHSSAISNGIYAKILGSGRGEYFGENFRLVLYFAIPLFAFSIAFARPALFTLNPIYEVATIIVVLLTIRVFFQTLNNLFDTALKGLEKVDLEENSSFKDYMKSKLFFLPTLTLIQRISYIVILSISLIVSIQFTQSELELVFYWSVIAAIVPIPFTIYRLRIILRHFSLNIKVNEIIKYLLSSFVVFTLAFYLMDEFLIYEKEIFVFLPNLLVYIIFSFLAYFAITIMIDSKTRKLTKTIITEIQNFKSGKNNEH